MKRFITTAAIGIGTGCFAFVCMLFLASWIAGGSEVFYSSTSGAGLLKSATACIAVSLGFSMPSLVYYNRKGVLILKVLLHMVVGTAVFLIIGSYAGWISGSPSEWLAYMLTAVASAVMIGGIIWARLKHDAKKMNAKLQSKGEPN